MPAKKQIPVLDQTTAKGTDYSCGFHAVKNGLLGLLLMQGKIDSTVFQTLSTDKAFFESLYNQITPNSQDDTIDLDYSQVNDALSSLQNGDVDLSSFGISNDDLTTLDYSQMTTLNMPFGPGEFGDDLFSNALEFAALAKKQGPFDHVFAVGNPAYGHWGVVYMSVNEQNQRSYTFMDSYYNQSTHFHTMTDGIENVIKKSAQEVDDYLLDVYEADNMQFEDLYNRFFDLSGAPIPKDGQMVQDPRHEDQMIPRGAYDDATQSDQHEWIDSTEYAKRHADTWSATIEAKIKMLEDANPLDNPSPRTQAHLQQLLTIATFITQTPNIDNSIKEKMQQVQLQLNQVLVTEEPSPELSSQSELSKGDIKISLPKVKPIEQQISNIKASIARLERSIQASTRLIETLFNKDTLKPNESRLLDKAKSGVTKKVDRLELYQHNLKAAEAMQQKYASTSSPEEPIILKQQLLKQQLKEAKDKLPQQSEKPLSTIYISHHRGP